MARVRSGHRGHGKGNAHGPAEHRAPRHAPPRTHHAGHSTYSHVRVEIDLGREMVAPGRLPFLAELTSLLREREVEESESLLELEAAVLHALHGCGFSRVDHWEVDPGGWLPLPEAVHPGLIEPVGHLLKALASDRWQDLAGAYAFSVRLSGDGDRRADAVLRRRHREREHSLSIELWGHVASFEVHRIVNALRDHLPVLRAQVTESTAA